MATLSDSLLAANKIMSRLGILPLAFEAASGRTEILADMPEDAVNPPIWSAHRSRTLFTRAVEIISIQMLDFRSLHFSVVSHGRWSRLMMSIPNGHVRVRFVVPDDAPPMYRPDPGNATLSIHLYDSLEFLSDSLLVAARYTGGMEPPAMISLSYPEDPEYEAKLARVAEEFRSRVPPIIPTLEIDRSCYRKSERTAHDKALRSVTEPHLPIEKLGRTGFEVRRGYVQIQDSGR